MKPRTSRSSRPTGSKKRIVLVGRSQRGYDVWVDGRKVALSSVLHDTMVELFIQRHLTREGYATIESSQSSPEHARLIIHRLRKAIGKKLIGNGYKTCYRLEVDKTQLGVEPAFFELKPGVDVGVHEFEQLLDLYPQTSTPK